AVEQGLKVLLVDFDRQRSLSHSFLATEGAEPGLLASALFSPDPLALNPEVLSENLHIIRADADALSLLMDVDRDMMKQPARHLRSMSGD
ncbi:ParA family protein, partial [Pseudomonas aeruginosa]